MRILQRLEVLLPLEFDGDAFTFDMGWVERVLLVRLASRGGEGYICGVERCDLREEEEWQRRGPFSREREREILRARSLSICFRLVLCIPSPPNHATGSTSSRCHHLAIQSSPIPARTRMRFLFQSPPSTIPRCKFPLRHSARLPLCAVRATTDNCLLQPVRLSHR